MLTMLIMLVMLLGVVEFVKLLSSGTERWLGKTEPDVEWLLSAWPCQSFAFEIMRQFVKRTPREVWAVSRVALFCEAW